MLRPLIPYKVCMSPYVMPGLPGKRTQTTQDIIIDAVCSSYDVILDKLKKRTRKRNIVEARQVIMYLLCYYTPLHLKAIGDIFGGYDHTTVIHSRKQIADLLYVDLDLAKRIMKIKSQAGLHDGLPKKITQQDHYIIE